MSQTAISIIGNEGSGKTVFVAALAHLLQDAPYGQTRLVPKNPATRVYVAGIMDEVNRSVWPTSTPAGKLESLDWDWVEPSGATHQVRVLDCAGQDFRQIFEEKGLSEHQKMLKQTLFSSRIVLLLVNLDEAISIGGLSQSKRNDVEMAPAFAVRHLREAGCEVLLLLTQSDKYRDLLLSKKLPTPRGALQHYLPQLGSTVLELNVQVFFISVIKTKNEILNGRSESRPIGFNVAVIKSVADQLGKSLIANRIQMEHEESARRDEQRLQAQRISASPPDAPQVANDTGGKILLTVIIVALWFVVRSASLWFWTTRTLVERNYFSPNRYEDVCNDWGHGTILVLASIGAFVALVATWESNKR